jgi:hypothetical protein
MIVWMGVTLFRGSHAPLSAESAHSALVPRVAFASALMGAAMGALEPAYHVAIEPAQVLAGLVSYPPDNPFYL